MRTDSVVSCPPDEVVGITEGRSDIASGRAERAHSCDAPRVDPPDM